MEANLLNHIGDVGTCKGEILKSSGEAAIECWVSDRWSCVGGKFCKSVDGCRGRISTSHSGSMNYVCGIILLV